MDSNAELLSKSGLPVFALFTCFHGFEVMYSLLLKGVLIMLMVAWSKEHVVRRVDLQLICCVMLCLA